MACLWSDELGTADAWYRLLSVGATVTPSAGTDAMVDFFRTMAIGTTRVYVHVPGGLTMDGYLDGLRAGRSFVTSGPLIRFTVASAGPGDVLTQTGDAPFELAVASAMPFERAEILVNGEVVWTGDGLAQPGTIAHRGTVTVPAGGWIAARVHGGEMKWPGMDSYPFAHTAPLWINSRGSTDPVAAARAGKELLAALDVAEQRVRQSYGDTPTPVLLGRLAEARTRLERLTR